jgi:ABC-2 type transport system ATP-binding protein
MTTPIISTESLVKTFGATRALDGLDLDVVPGEVHGFLGPNGAGKSTTIRVLLGLIKATSGNVTLFGKDPWQNAVALHSRLAYVPGDVTLWPNATGGETIDFLANLRGGLAETKRKELVEKFDFDPSKRGRTYSKGNRQKVAIIAALASNAELLVLDEPTSGLDPLMESIFQAEIRAVRAEGRTVLLSTHILSEAEELADRISIIREGRIVESGTLAQMRYHSMTTVRATLPEGQIFDDSLDFLQDVTIDGNSFSGLISNDALPQGLRRLSDLKVQSLTVAPPSLEDLFQKHYEGPDGQATR